MVLTLSRKHRRWLDLALWWMIFLVALWPVAHIASRAFVMALGADPAKAIVDFLGIWALRFLWITLAITPCRKLFGWRKPVRYRRMLGLFAFFYAVLHLLAFMAFILGWRADLLIREISERPYVIVGALALLLMVPLAITSTKGWQRRLAKRWHRLHRLIYLISLLVLLHFVWLIRADYSEALLYGGLLALMLGYRVISSRSAPRSA